MGTDDLFKKRREQRRRRKYDYKQPRVNSFLIVTEGERTEPAYFRGLQQQIQEKMGGTVDIVEIPLIDIYGEGTSTGRLVEKAGEIINKANIIYQNIWIVFDKDDFTDFDKAITIGAEKGYQIAWSNQCFEYWLYLHFCYNDAALHRNDWIEKLDKIFQEYGLGNGTYQKNYEDIYNIVNCYDGVETAIKNAKRRMADFNIEKCKPSEYDPGTTVHILVEKLKKYLDE